MYQSGITHLYSLFSKEKKMSIYELILPGKESVSVTVKLSLCPFLTISEVSLTLEFVLFSLYFILVFPIR